MKSFVQKNFYYFALGATFLVALFLRVYHLVEVPGVVYGDEAGLGYNAWCIANYGVDRYLNELPIYPQNMDGGQSPLYTYLVVLLIKTIGRGNVSMWLIRLPGVFSSMVVVLAGTKTIATIFHNRKITLMSALLLTICPYYIMHGRFALDCNLMLGCSAVALYLLVRYIYSNKLRDLVITGIAFGVVLYSYAMSYFVIPMFLVMIALYMLYTGKITFRRTILWAVIVCVTAMPVLLFIFSLLFELEEFHFLWFSISPVASARMEEVGSADFLEKIINVIKITLTNGYFKLDAVKKFYTMYVISIPFIVIGFLYAGWQFISSIKKRCFHVSAIYFLFYICGLITVGFTKGNLIYRANYLFISYLYFLVTGIYVIYRFVRSYQKYFIGVLGCCYLLWSISFLRYYFTMYSVTEIYSYPNSLFCVLASDIVDYVQDNLNVKDIYLDYVTASEYFCIENPISPYEKKALEHDDGFGNYYFNINYYTPIDEDNAYIVRKENQEFNTLIRNYGNQYNIIEYPYYYLYYFE